MSSQRDVRYLAGSPHRLEILCELRRAPRRPCELASRCEATRTTVHRILSGFSERRWVVKRDAAYAATDTGRRVLSAYESLLEEVERADQYGTFAANLPPLDDGLPPAAYTATEVTNATDRSPLAPLERFVSAVTEIRPRRFVGIAPIATQYFDETTAHLAECGTEIEVVVCEGIVDAGGFDDFDEGVRPSVFVYPERVEFGLAVGDAIVFLGAYDDRGNLVSLVEGTDPSLREWALDVFEEYRGRSRPVETL